MTFCPNCGASLEPGAAVCPRCEKMAGAAPAPPQPYQPYQLPHPIYPNQPVPPAYPPYRGPASPGMNTYAVLGFIMAFLPLPFAGLALCILGLVQCSQPGPDGRRQKGRGLAIAGILVRVLGAALIVAGIAAAVWYFADSGNLPDVWEWDDSFAFTVLM